ncbi:MAG: Gfo/Idh/MocA family oxidoreductase [Clostridia bacterium]|nr:Gfo/Idh/MocA family oxidoreductase [Clostridia bacterium]
MSKKLKIGIIGTGNIAEEHISAYKKNPNVELYAFCDLDEELLKQKGEKHGVTRLFTDKNEMLKLEEIDAVSVCTWNSEHAPCTIAALNAGKHVLCEKPMAMNEKEAREMQEAAVKNNKLLMIGFVRRFGNDCTVLEDFIEKDYLGEIYYAKATYLRRDGNPGGWFGDKSRSGGGPLIDLGVHVIDLVRYLSGKPKPVSVYGATFQKLFNRKGTIGAPKYLSASASDNDICDVEDLASALIRFDNGEVLSVEAAFSLNIKEPQGTIELFGTKAGAKLNPQLEIYGVENNYQTNLSFAADTGLAFSGLFDNEINHYVDCIINGSECKSPAEDGIEMMKILDAVYESARTGHEVIL